MKKSDIGVIGFIYLVALTFYVMTIELPEEAQTYPLGLIIALTVLNTLYLLRCLVKWSLTKQLENDLPKIFEGFQAKQFAGIVLGCVLFLVMMHYLGYYVASAIYLVGTMLFLKVKKWQIAIVLVCLVALVYAVFSLFLQVPLPLGVLFN